MRFSVLFFLLAILFCAPAFAEDAPRGVLPSDKAGDIFKDAKPEQIEEALKISAQCSDTDYLRTYYDCDCLGMKFLELRKARGDVVSSTVLLIEAERSCPNSTDVAGTMFSQCKSWARNMRPRNFEEFCTCFASNFAKQYERNTTDNPYVREAQMTRAYSQCDQGKMLQDRLDKERDIERLKKEGVYDFLFPGAAKK